MFLPQMFRGRQYSGNSFWEAMLGGVRSSQSKTGIIITPETALGLSAVGLCHPPGGVSRAAAVRTLPAG